VKLKGNRTVAKRSGKEKEKQQKALEKKKLAEEKGTRLLSKQSIFGTQGEKKGKPGGGFGGGNYPG